MCGTFGNSFIQNGTKPHAQERRQCSTETLVDQVLAAAEEKPTLLVLENTHGLDPTMLEFVDQLAGRIASS